MHIEESLIKDIDISYLIVISLSNKYYWKNNFSYTTSIRTSISITTGVRSIIFYSKL